MSTTNAIALGALVLSFLTTTIGALAALALRAAAAAHMTQMEALREDLKDLASAVKGLEERERKDVALAAAAQAQVAALETGLRALHGELSGLRTTIADAIGRFDALTRKTR